MLSVFADDAGTALRGARDAAGDGPGADVRLRIAATHADKSRVEEMLHEVTALYTCGPAGGGGVRLSATPRLGSASCFIPRDVVAAGFTMFE